MNSLWISTTLLPQTLYEVSTRRSCSEIFMKRGASLCTRSSQRSFVHRLRQAIAELLSQEADLRLFEQAEMVSADLAQIHSARRHSPPDRVGIIQAADRF